MTNNKTGLLILCLAVITAAIVHLEFQKPDRTAPPENSEIQAAETKPDKAKKFERAKEISTPDTFINTDSITISSLIGKKIILIDFWTYSCINCQRTTPYLNAWYEKYREQGLEIIGIHTPEFAFEEELENVKKAVEKFGIKFPVVLDNDYSTWTAYKNRYWPRKYLIDIDGYIVYDHIGEGAYEETERKIQETLAERALVLGVEEYIPEDTVRPAVTAPEPGKVKSPEIYFGSARGSNLADILFEEPAEVNLNRLYLIGDWEITKQYATNKKARAKILFLYHARDVFLVGSAESPVRVNISRDGKFIKSLIIQEEQLYPLIEGEDYGEHLLEIEIMKPGIRAYTFTFG